MVSWASLWGIWSCHTLPGHWVFWGGFGIDLHDAVTLALCVPGKPAQLGWCQVTQAAWGVPWLHWTAAAAALNTWLTEIILLGCLISASCLRGSNFSGTLFLSERISCLHIFYTLEPASEHLPYCLSAVWGFSFMVPIYFGSYFKGIEYITAGKAWQLGLWPQFLEELFISQWIMR